MDEVLQEHLEEMDSLLITMKETTNKSLIRVCLERYKELENQLKVFMEMWGIKL